MSEIVVTLKADGAPWIVIHGDTPEDTEKLLDYAAEITPRVVEAARSFKSAGAGAGNAGGNRPGGGGFQQRQPAANNAGPLVTLQVPFDDAAGRQSVKDAGGRWNGDKKGWNVPADVAQQFPQYRQI